MADCPEKFSLVNRLHQTNLIVKHVNQLKYENVVILHSLFLNKLIFSHALISEEQFTTKRNKAPYRYL